jgi:SAM-dependent methyltransferase
MAWDKIWESVFASQAWGQYPSEEVIRFVARHFYTLKDKPVTLLEVGFGVGANIWYMAREGFDVYGIEGSKTACAQAHVRLREEGLSAQLDVGDIMTLPYEDNSFDGVLDVECLYSNDYISTETILKEIHRVMKPGATFFSRTFTDQQYCGITHTPLSDFEYCDVSDGPFAGKGFVRLTPERHIDSLYGKYFDIVSVDLMENSVNNREYVVSEWAIVCGKPD